MKILHVSDLHCAADEHSAMNVMNAVKQMCIVARHNEVKLSFIAGDLFHSRLPLDSPGVKAAVSAVISLAEIAPVFILRGTPVHDAGDTLKIFEALKTVKQVRVIDKPYMLNVNVNENNSKLGLFFLPGMRKSMFAPVAEKYGADMLKTTAAELIELQLRYWSEHREQSDDTVMIGHMQIDAKEFKMLESGYEPLVRKDAIVRYLNPSIVMMGHIHDSYRDGRFYYSGSLVADDMNDALVINADNGVILKDRSIKGFFIHETVEPKKWNSVFYEVEAKKYLKIKTTDAGFDNIMQIVASNYNDGVGLEIKIEADMTSIGAGIRSHMDKLLEIEGEIQREYEGKGVIVRPSTINVQAFNVSSRIQSSDCLREWTQLTLDQKMLKWASEKGYDIPEEEMGDYVAKIASLG